MNINIEGPCGRSSLQLLKRLSILFFSIHLTVASWAQGSEDLTGLPQLSSSSYLPRTWNGNNGGLWNANGARTDRTLNGRAICFGPSGVRNIISPSYTGGIGVLSFSYVRDFTNTQSRSLQIWINGAQVGPTLIVDNSSDVVLVHNQPINIAGDVVVEIRSIGAGQVKIDDISWTAFNSGPTVSFVQSASSYLENAGTVQVQLGLSPAPATASTINVAVTNGPGTSAADYTTDPAIAGGMIQLDVPAGTTSLALLVSIVDDNASDPIEETITFSLIGTTGDLQLGGNSTHVLTIIDDDAAPATVLEPGDLVILGVNTNDQACGGTTSEDLISFLCFKPIVPGTSIIITDNGYQRCMAGLWGNNEGTVRMMRTGPAIPAGQVITFRFVNNFGPGNVAGVAPDNGWTCTSLNGNTTVNMNAGGDQIFFMQGGTWDPGVLGSHNASYSGTVLFAFTSNPNFPWTASCSTDPSRRSDLPPGIDCFSMAPTLATDFNKYVGPITAETQRNWIIRLDDPLNWTSYTGCANFNSQGYDWLTAPILPITSASFQPGKWTGAINTDWFECKNWEDAHIPTLLTEVLIDQDAIRNCVVGLDPGVQPAGAGACASLTLSNAGTSRNLILAANSALTVNGPIVIERTAGVGNVSITVQANAVLSGTSISLTSVDPSEATLTLTNASSSVAVEGDVTMGTGGQIDLGNGGSIALGGHWNNSAGEASFIEGSGSVNFNGASDQSINTVGLQEIFFNLTLMKSGGSLSLADPVAISGMLDLQNGLLNTSATELLTLNAGSSTINASDASFVKGPLEKIGVTDFIFPIGKGNSLRPCGLKNITGSLTDTFTAEYFSISPLDAFGDSIYAGLDHISDCEYWMIDRSNGNANASVELSWDTPESCGISDLLSLRVSRWNGATWLDRGNGGTTGDLASGMIEAVGEQAEFGPWTLASIDGSNPLPITLISFTAEAEHDRVRLDWRTATELNNERFAIERSGNGIDYHEIISLPGAGTSYNTINYSAFDPAPINGMNYYRLLQIDEDGTSTHSPIATAFFNGTRSDLVINATEEVINVIHELSDENTYEILDVGGRTIAKGSASGSPAQIPVKRSLARGTYVLKLSDGARSQSAPFIY